MAHNTEANFDYLVQISNSDGSIEKYLNNEVDKLSWSYIRNGGCDRLSLILKRNYDDFIYITETAKRSLYDIQVWIKSSESGNYLCYWRGYTENIRPNLSDNEEITIDFNGYIQRLEKLIVSDGSGNPKTYTATTISGVVNSLITDFITPNTDITVGTIDTYSINVSKIVFNSTVLEAIQKLANIVGAEWGVNRNLQFYFRQPSDIVGHYFKVGQDIIEIEDEYDYSDIINKVYIQGGDLPSGIPFRYTKTDQESIMYYGLHETIVTDSSIIDSKLAESHANILLSNKKSFLRNIRANLPLNKDLIELDNPMKKALIIPMPKPITHKYGTFKYCGKIDQATGGTAISSGDGTNPYLYILLPMDGADESTTFDDSSGNGRNFTAVANAQVDTSWKKFGSGSLLCDGTGDYIYKTDALVFGTSDFVVDFRIKFAAADDLCTFFSIGNGAAEGLYFYRDNGSNIHGYYMNREWSASYTWSTSTDYHVAVVRYGNYLYVYIDGILIGNPLDVTDANMTDDTKGIYIGSWYGYTAEYWHNGWIDEFRIINGQAVWTGSPFTPPTSAYTATQDKSLAFDNDTASFWQSTGTVLDTAYIGYDLGEGNEKAISTFSIQQYSASFAVSSIRFQASSNGSDWYTIKTKKLFPNTFRRVFDVLNTVAYRYYRILAHSASSGNSWKVAEVELLKQVGKEIKYTGLEKLTVERVDYELNELSLNTSIEFGVGKPDFLTTQFNTLQFKLEQERQAEGV